MAKKDPNTPQVISGSAVGLLSILATRLPGKHELYRDDAGREYREPPRFVYLMDAKFELQEVEPRSTMPGESSPDRWWHYHRVS
jgi:hypothetical protein